MPDLTRLRLEPRMIRQAFTTVDAIEDPCGDLIYWPQLHELIENLQPPFRKPTEELLQGWTTCQDQCLKAIYRALKNNG